MNMNKKKGIGLLEVVIAVSILGAALMTIVVTYRMYLKAALSNTEIIKVTYLAEEGMEAVRLLRDESWGDNIGSLSFGTEYFLTYATTTNKWSVASTSQDNMIADRYYRTVVFDEVERGSGDDIVASGGTSDSETRFVTVSMSWFEGDATTTRSLSGYITNLFNN